MREIRAKDGENFINVIKHVERQSEFMLIQTGERKNTSEQQRKQLERIEQQRNSTIFVAEIEGAFVGYLMAMGGNVKRTKHSAYIVVGILEKYRGKGIGTELFNNVMEWAAIHNILRLELTTVIENTAGLALYKKTGFEIEGTKRNSLMINNKLFDEYYMSKLL